MCLRCGVARQPPSWIKSPESKRRLHGKKGQLNEKVAEKKFNRHTDIPTSNKAEKKHVVNPVVQENIHSSIFWKQIVEGALATGERPSGQFSHR